MGFYTATGKVNTTTLVAATNTGLYAADGGINIVLDDAVNSGFYHPWGAVRVNSATGDTQYDASGAAYSNHLFGIGKGP